MKLIATGYNHKGEAITKYNDKVFYVPGLLIGEVAICEIETEKEKWGRARIKELLEVSKNRNLQTPKNHLKIGGYEIFHMNRAEQTKFKTNKVLDDFNRIAGTVLNLEPMFIGDKQLRYRNKITLHDGAFHTPGTNDKIFMEDFLLTDIKPKTELKGEVIIRKLDTTIIGNKNDKKFTTDTMMGLKFTIALGAFYQVNKEVAEAAYKDIISELSADDIVLDLFSGIGTITLLAAQKAKTVIGVERNKISHDGADFNKNYNKIKNASFVNDEVKNFLNTTDQKANVIIVDPAREGLGKQICKNIISKSPDKIIYLSCNPGTQAADFNNLKKHYEITKSRIFDMFPQTHHIENLLILKKK